MTMRRPLRSPIRTASSRVSHALERAQTRPTRTKPSLGYYRSGGIRSGPSAALLDDFPSEPLDNADIMPYVCTLWHSLAHTSCALLGLSPALVLAATAAVCVHTSALRSGSRGPALAAS